MRMTRQHLERKGRSWQRKARAAQPNVQVVATSPSYGKTDGVRLQQLAMRMDRPWVDPTVRKSVWSASRRNVGLARDLAGKAGSSSRGMNGRLRLCIAFLCPSTKHLHRMSLRLDARLLVCELLSPQPQVALALSTVQLGPLLLGRILS